MAVEKLTYKYLFLLDSDNPGQNCWITFNTWLVIGPRCPKSMLKSWDFVSDVVEVPNLVLGERGGG